MRDVMRAIGRAVLFTVLFGGAVVALSYAFPKADAHHNGRCHYVTVNGGVQVYVCP